MAIAYNIPVDVPQIPGAPVIDYAELKSKVQDFVNSLYVHVLLPQTKSKVADHKYSERLQRLRKMSHKAAAITEDDLREDDRLTYLLLK